MNFNQIIFSALLLICSFQVSAGDLLKRTVEISKVDSVEIQGPGVLEISQGDTELLEIIASEKVMPRVDVSARGSNLRLRLKERNGFGLFGFDQDVHFKLHVKDLKKIHVTGSADVKAMTDITSDELVINRSGSGDILLMNVTCFSLRSSAAGAGDFKANIIDASIAELESAGAGDYSIEQINAKEFIRFESAGAGDLRINQLTSKTFQLSMAGAGDAKVGSGEVESQEVSVSGSGDFYASKLKSKVASIELSGAANASVWVTDHLTGSANGASDIEYYGNPAIKVNTSGASSISSSGKAP
ncbi:hypothetical protein TDB9533_01748 [Thalassocella blandensis]|nr:hypothetical protein TDB9533_01748 [Thalassocella blandensis]